MRKLTHLMIVLAFVALAGFVLINLMGTFDLSSSNATIARLGTGGSELLGNPEGQQAFAERLNNVWAAVKTFFGMVGILFTAPLAMRSVGVLLDADR